MTDDRFEDFLKMTAREYRDPPPLPREEMWREIVAARQAAKRAGERSSERDGGRAVRRLGGRKGDGNGEGPSTMRGWWSRGGVWVTWALPLAAALALGVIIGRMARVEPAPPSLSIEAADSIARAALEQYALAHLRDAEAFLTSFRVDARTGRVDEELGEPARALLTTTRLLLDTPAGEDVPLHTVLGDLELVLTQIAQFQADRGRADEELELIDHGIEQRGVMLKLRAAIDADPVPMVAQGVL